MRFIRGVFSLMAAMLFSVGIAVFIASFFRRDFESFRIAGVVMVVLAAALNLLFAAPQPKGYKGVAFAYFLANGFILFSYLTIIGIPIGKAIANSLPESFSAWKEGDLSGYSRQVSQEEEFAIMRYLSLSEFLD